MFCIKCKSIMLPKKKGSKTVLTCSKCGYSSTQAKAVLSEKVKKDKRKMDVVEKEETPLPTTEADCSKCGNNKAYYWFLQTRASDEPETQFLKCTKCSHQWRNYD